MISLAAVKLTEETVELVSKVIRENAIGQSVYIEQFEEAVAAYTGETFCIATSSGSMADIILLAACKEIYNCRQVIVPALTFIAQPNAVRINGLDVVWCDVAEDFLIDTDTLEDLPMTDDNPAIVFATALMGRMNNWEECFPFPVIEDACEAFGSDRNCKDSEAVAATFSFFPSHTITTGEGGCIVTSNIRLAEICRSLRNHGRKKEWTSIAPFNKFSFERFGFNGKMAGINAAIGISQMSTIHETVKRRKDIYTLMCKELGMIHYAGTCAHGMPVKFNSESERDVAMRKLTEADIECRKLFSCIPTDETYYKRRRRQEEFFPTACRLSTTHLYVPCHQQLTDEDVANIIYTCKRLPGRLTDY